MVLSGRLRSVVQRGDGRKELVGEFGRGELCGIVETLTGARRSTTLLAVRDTEIAKIPSGLINSIMLRFPKVVSKLITLLGRRLLRMQHPQVAPKLLGGHASQAGAGGLDSAEDGASPGLQVRREKSGIMTLKCSHLINQRQNEKMTNSFVRATPRWQLSR